jgi:hypothetical protein
VDAVCGLGGEVVGRGAAGRGSVNMASPSKLGERGGFCGGRRCQGQGVQRRRGEHDTRLRARLIIQLAVDCKDPCSLSLNLSIQ